jgi:CheY-like chemotaxis protein
MATDGASNSPFRILRASTRDELLRQLQAAHAEKWALFGEILRTHAGDDERWYCQVVPAKDPADGAPEGGFKVLKGARSQRVLVVEDHVNTGTALVRLLGDRGFIADLARDGAEALTKVISHPYDILICDIGLPDIDGWSLLGRLRASLPHLHAIAMTGFGQPEDVDRSRAAGFQHHLIKPPSIDVALNAISAAAPRATDGRSSPFPPGEPDNASAGPRGN